MLIIFSGLPGVGKTTIAREIARATAGVHVRVDSIEQRLRDAGWRVDGEGYAVAYAIAEDNLRLGRTVIADCVNPWTLTRDAWRAVAARAGVRVIDVEIVCSDQAEHRRRVLARNADIPNHRLPTWQDVIERDYQPWRDNDDRIIVDTCRASLADSVRAITSRCGVPL